MDSSNSSPLSGSFSALPASLRRFSVGLALVAAFAFGACSAQDAAEDDDNTEADGIGTSPSDPPPTPPPPEGSRRLAGHNDPTGCPEGLYIVLGTTGNDVLQGTGASECFVGLAGDDVVFARGGHDVVIAGPRVDVRDGAVTFVGHDDSK